MTVAVRLFAWGGMGLSMLTSGCAATGTRSAGESADAPLLACRLANYGKYEDTGWAHLHSMGIKHVFISVPTAGQVDKVEQKLAQYGLDAVVMRGSTDLSKESSVEELAGQMAMCRRMRVKYMFLSAKLNGADRKVVYDRLRRAGDVARENGVTIVLETHPELGTNADVHSETMRAINHPNVRVNFDTGNVTYYNRGTTALAELKKIVDYVATVEIKDHNGEFETWNFPAFGKGVVDIAGVLRVLQEHGYHGPITIEIEGVKGQDRSEARIRKDLEDSVAYLRSIQSFR
ncbi:MAG: sugar phosphate isomerase/epimerase [Planctomycetes bacterium]|nr:sugar phosphate isomerase/epimerase [Planctomycetota bacterium]